MLKYCKSQIWRKFEIIENKKTKKQKIGINIISNIVFDIIKWKTMKNNPKKKEDKELKLIVTYLIAFVLRVTPPTSKDHYWTLMLYKMLFQAFNNNNTTRKKREAQIKRKKKIGNNILVWYRMLDTKMENYKKQYTNKRRRQRIEIEIVTYFLSCW